MRHWLILFLLALPCLAGAVSFNEQVERLPLGQSIDVFEDVRGSADINDITSRAIDSSFRRHDKDVLNAGAVAGAECNTVIELKLEHH
ncbi:hypothetical protein, partial [Pseudomonas aeruginosa]|uniref:hypothetical protein n=1 Tax=Pseudomonas aeruginosa TaxID=287 RepID=UPI000EC7F410